MRLKIVKMRFRSDFRGQDEKKIAWRVRGGSVQGIRLAACAALLRLRLAEFENSDKNLAVIQHAVLPPSGGGGG